MFSSQGCRCAPTLGQPPRVYPTLKGLISHMPNAFSVGSASDFRSQGSSSARTLGLQFQLAINPERVKWLANPFRVECLFKILIPGLSLRSNPGLELANAFGVNFQTHSFGVNFQTHSFGVISNALL